MLDGLVRLSRVAVPAFDSTVKTVEDALPVVREARPYVPDLIGGLINGFGGTTAGYYDANGHYVRISFQGSTATPTGLGTLVPRPPEQQGLTGFRTGVDKRCPGAATQPAEDGSNPFLDTAVVRRGGHARGEARPAPARHRLRVSVVGDAGRRAARRRPTASTRSSTRRRT